MQLVTLCQWGQLNPCSTFHSHNPLLLRHAVLIFTKTSTVSASPVSPVVHAQQTSTSARMEPLSAWMEPRAQINRPATSASARPSSAARHARRHTMTVLTIVPSVAMGYVLTWFAIELASPHMTVSAMLVGSLIRMAFVSEMLTSAWRHHVTLA